MIATMTESLIVACLAGVVSYYGLGLVFGLLTGDPTVDIWWLSLGCVCLFLKDLYYA